MFGTLLKTRVSSLIPDSAPVPERVLSLVIRHPSSTLSRDSFFWMKKWRTGGEALRVDSLSVSVGQRGARSDAQGKKKRDTDPPHQFSLTRTLYKNAR